MLAGWVVYLERAVLELQAGVLLPANYPRLATEGIAAGRDGEILRAMSALLGESQVRVLEVVSDIPDIESAASEFAAPSQGESSRSATSSVSVGSSNVRANAVRSPM